MRNILLVALFFTPVMANADDARAVEALQNLMADLRTLQADFTQTVLTDELETVRQSSGTFYLQRAKQGEPGRFRWDYTAPFEQVIVGDGVNLWTYDPDLEQATVKPMEQTLASSPASLLMGGTVPLQQEFDIREIGRSGALYWIGLRARIQDTDFERVRVGLQDGKLDTMELLDNLGQTTRIRFENLRRNVDIPAKTFRFTPPEGADVIGEVTPSN